MWMTTWEESHLHHPWLVAREGGDGDVIGFAKASQHRSRAAYAWTAEASVYIAPEHKGQGVGTALYGALIPLLRAQGYVTLLAGITTGHDASERLHAKAGFERCGTFHRAGWKYGRWHDVGYWELQLQAADHVPGTIRAVLDVGTDELTGGPRPLATSRR